MNLESEDKKQCKEKLTLSNGQVLPDPNVLDVGWKEAVHCLPDLCFADIFNYLKNTPSDYTKENLKAYKSLEAYNFFVCGHVHDISDCTRLPILLHQNKGELPIAGLAESLCLQSKHRKRVSLASV